MKRFFSILFIFSVCIFSLTLTSCKKRKTEQNNPKSSNVTQAKNTTTKNNTTTSIATTTLKTYEKLTLEEFIEAFNFGKYNTLQESYNYISEVELDPYFYRSNESGNIVQLYLINGDQNIHNNEYQCDKIIFDVKSFKEDLSKDCPELSDDEIDEIINCYFMDSYYYDEYDFIEDENGNFVSIDESTDEYYSFLEKVGEGYIEKYFNIKGDLYSQSSYVIEDDNHLYFSDDLLFDNDLLTEFYNASSFDNLKNEYIVISSDLSEEVQDNLSIVENATITILFNENKTVNTLSVEYFDEEESESFKMSESFGYEDIKVTRSDISLCQHEFSTDYSMYTDYYQTNVGHFNVCVLCNEYLNCEEHTYNSDRICTICGHKEKKTLDFTIEAMMSYGMVGEVGVEFLLDPVTLNIIDLDDAERKSMRIVRTTYEPGGRAFEREYNSNDSKYKILFNHSEEDIPDTYNMIVNETIRFYDLTGEEEVLLKQKEFNYTLCKHSHKDPIVEHLDNCFDVTTISCEYCNKVLSISSSVNHEFTETPVTSGCETTRTHTCSKCSYSYNSHSYTHELTIIDCDIDETFNGRPSKCKVYCDICKKTFDGYVEYMNIYETYHSCTLYYSINDVVYEKYIGGFFGMPGPHTFNDEGRCTVCGCYNPQPEIQLSETITITPLKFDPETNNLIDYDLSYFGEQVDTENGYTYGNVEGGTYARVTYISETNGCEQTDGIIIEMYMNNILVYRYGESYTDEYHGYDEYEEVYVLENGLHILKFVCLNDGCNHATYYFEINHDLDMDYEWIPGTCTEYDVLYCEICEKVIYKSTPYLYHHSDEDHKVDVLIDDGAALTLYQCLNCSKYVYYSLSGFSHVSDEDLGENHYVSHERSNNYTLDIDSIEEVEGDFIKNTITLTLTFLDDSTETIYDLEVYYPNTEIVEGSKIIYEDYNFIVFETPSGNVFITYIN